MAAAGFAGLGGGSKRGGSDEEGEIDFRDFKSPPRLQMQDNMSVVCSAQDFSGTKNPRWLFDCGATDTMTYDPSDIIGSSKPTKHHIQTANGGYAPVQGAGSVELSPTLKISNCLYVPSLSCKLLSISHVTKELNCTVLMHPHFCLLQDIRTKEIIGRGTERGGLYYVDEVARLGSAMLAHGTVDRQWWLWHRRLGHPSAGYLQLLFPKLPKHSDFKCQTCILSKSHRQTFRPTNTKVDEPFSLVHSDVWGPAPNSGNNKSYNFFLLFVDDCTRMTWVYLLKQKAEVYQKFTHFYNMVQTQFQKQLRILRCDNGGEFINHSMQSFFREKGLIHQTTCPNTPQQNGVAERKNRLLLEITRALMLEAHTPTHLWPEAVTTATYLINCLPTKILNFKTPLQTLSTHTRVPKALTLSPRIFGCSVFVHIPKNERTKFDPCALKCVFVGYGVNQKGYRCYHPPSRRIYTTMNCDFLETEYFYTAQPSAQGEEITKTDPLSWLLEPVLSEIESTSTQGDPIMVPSENKEQSPEPVDCTQSPPPDVLEVNISPATPTIVSDNETAAQETVVTPPRYILPPRSTRGIPPRRYSPELQSPSSRYPVDDRRNLAGIAKAFSAALYSEDIPRNIHEALQKKEWCQAMKMEMEALAKNETWEKCTLPDGKKLVGCRWVFTIKHKADGTIERYKARLVAKGYTQTYGVDYSETFSPVANIKTIRVLFSVAVNQNWSLHQFDVKNAFLHGVLSEEERIYMEVPPGFSEGFKDNEVCRLKKSLYGLKQSPKAWFGRFTVAMVKFGYQQSNSDHTLFIKRRGKMITCLIIYVDDMIITGDDIEEIEKLRNNLFKEFEMKDLGRLKYFLGIEVLRSKKGLFISQRKYVMDLLTEIGLIDCKPAETPMVVNHNLRIV